jgi:CRP-like cAMP-binding protein
LSLSGSVSKPARLTSHPNGQFFGEIALLHDRPRSATVTAVTECQLLVLEVREFRSLLLRYPQWGWSLLNGVITLLAGIVIYRHFPESAIWVIGLLVGLEMLFSGWKYRSRS